MKLFSRFSNISVIVTLCLFISGALSLNLIDVNNPTISFNSFEYQYIPQEVNWQAAEKACNVWGGSLVSVGSEDEDNFLRYLTRNETDTMPLWIGYSDREVSGQWMWTDLSDPSFNLFEESSNVQPGCAVSVDRNVWQSVSCNQLHGFVCKRPEGECAWTNTVLGAPIPLVSTQQVNNEIVITATLGKRESGTVYNALAFQQINTSLAMCFSSISDDFDSELWDVTERSCFRQFQARLSVSQFIAMTDPTLESATGSDILHFNSELHMAYFDTTNDGCIISRYHTDLKLRSILNVDSTVEFAADDIEVVLPPIVDALYLNNDRRLVVEAIIQPADPIFYFTDFEFVQHSNGIPFLVENVLSCPNDESTSVACSYRVILVSTETVSDFSGQIELSLIFHWPNGRADRAAVTFTINYELIEDGDIPSEISGVVYFVDNDNWTKETDVITPFFRSTLLTTTDPRVDDTTANLEVRDVYLCCTKDRQVLPAYNPDQGQFGCTQQDDETMSFWTKLVSNGAANSLFQVHYEDPGRFEYTTSAISFNPLLLYGEDKLCYVHASTTITTDDEEEQLESSTAISFKSCSFFGTEEECISQVVCRWDPTLGVCWNLGQNGASSLQISFAATILVAFMAIAILM
mmetsp:Transcript_7277/g.27244  ORF Transcript_7277/g.27244 Transcript_7277/m.27244 type:complete len:634 (-) Transcript_7277:405-2306(-)|eukprot:CAMPEP_0117444018 /NCGR_PEP_ID=MMETSP0759-20121206/5011_1 /TAXON_ID=63605 /ORGANISM="Percolomonas cosmopolitus, Strain WS" /LENGTH=633 /DNA_ID=CAMNT_0005236045 /DNA_START=90 /DNA_END=1991 /DNA_ORIENTATION=-